MAIFILGLSGSNEFKSYFDTAPELMRQVLLWNGYPQKAITRLSEEGNEDKRWGKNLLGTKENILKLLEDTAKKNEMYEEVFIFIAGHANGRDDEAMLHLPGDDLIYSQLMEGIKAISAKKMFLVVAASQGGAWIEKLSAPNRVIVAGNGFRQYDFIPLQFLRFFPEMFVEAAKPVNEDKTEWQVSLLDAFTRTQQKIRNWYRVNNLHCTELALLDSNGDGQGNALFESSVDTKGNIPVKFDSPTTESQTRPFLEERDKVLPFDLSAPDAKSAEKIYFKIQKEKKS